MFEPNDRYTGKPNRYQKKIRILLTVIVVLVMLFGTVIIFNQFRDYETGKTIEMDGLLFALYQMVGKWIVAALFLGITFFIAYAGYKQMIADYKMDDDDES